MQQCLRVAVQQWLLMCWGKNLCVPKSRYLIRDRDRVYGTMVTRRVRAMGIRDKPIALAKLFCGKIDRVDPTGMSRPFRHTGRSAPAPDSRRLCRLL